MFGPDLGPRRRSIWALAAAAAFITQLGMTAGTALAQSETRARELPDTYDFEPGRGASRAEVEPDDAISRLFADGLEDLEDGHFAAAQNAFERVIARDPDGHLAGEARQYLADLYRRKPGADRGGDQRPGDRVSVGPAADAGSQAQADRRDAEQRTAAANRRFDEQRSSLGAADIVPVVTRNTPPTASLGFDVADGVEEAFISKAGDRVFFAAGSAELGQRARVVLAAQARWLASHLEFNAVIEGHADDGAMPKDQLIALSGQRAMAVRDRLIAEGIAAERLGIAGAGRTQPVADCGSPDCAAQNRRVVTVLRSNVRDVGSSGRPRAVAAEQPRPTQ